MITDPAPPPPTADAPRQRPRGDADGVRIAPLLSAGVIVGVITVVLSISMASLVYGGPLSDFLPNGIGIALISTAIVGMIFALLGSLPGTAAFSQLTPGAILATMATAVVAALPAEAEPLTMFMTTVAAIALTTAAAGLAFLLVGHFRLGRLVRYMPYPVVGGFIAGTGWLLLTGGIRVMSDVSPSLSYLPDLVAPGVAIRWLPGLVLALLVVVVTRRSRHPLAFPGLIATSVAAFYLAMSVGGGSADAWRARGLLLGPFVDADLLQPLRLADLQHVDWGVVAAQGAVGATVVFVSLMAILFSATALERTFERKADLNQELRAAGLGNLLAGSVGGTIGFQALSMSLLNQRLGSAHRAAPLISVAVVVATITHGATLLEYVPTLVVGGVLSYLGLVFLMEWVHGAFSTLTRLEYGVVLAILSTIIGLGFLPGVGVGLILAVALFVVSYSRIDVVRHALTGSSARSRVSWAPRERLALERDAERVGVLQLQGFLFFGSANAPVEHVERRLGAEPPLEYLILDFRHVNGMDSTASASFVWLALLAQRAGFRLAMSDLAPGLLRQLERSGFRAGSDVSVPIFETLDEALEWCERRRLAALLPPRDGPDARSPAASPAEAGGEVLLPCFERVEVAPGGRFITQGDPADELYLVASGQVTARLELADGSAMRLETMQGDGLVGEIGFYTGSPRGASVFADETTLLYRITRDDLEDLTRRDARAAAEVHRLVARRLAVRVAHLQRVVTALQR